jgi:hypothetical protein
MLVPENIFELAPTVDNILDYGGLGAQFKAFQNKSKFSISITFEVSNLAYYEDDGLIINNKAIDLNNLGTMLLDNYGYDGTLNDLVLLNTIQGSVSQESLDQAESDINDALDMVNNGIDDPSTLPDCPKLTEEDKETLSASNTTSIDVVNADNVIIETVTMDLSDNTKICKSASGIEETLKATFLNALPKINPGNDIEPTITDPLCALPDDSELKGIVQTETQRLNLGASSIEEYNNNLIQDGIAKAVSDQLKVIEDNTGVSVLDASTEVLNNQVNDLLQTTLPTYGIPLLQINLEKNLIIQINNGQLEVLNFDKYIDGQSITDETTQYLGSAIDPNLEGTISDSMKKKLEINIIDNPDAKIIPEVIYTMVYTRNYNYHTIELKKFYGTDTYKDEESTSTETGLYYLGMDKSGLKQFCGKIYDVHLQEDQIDINNITFGQNYFPDLYGALAYYDFFNKSEEETRIVYNKVYPYKSLGKPLSMRGRNWYLETRKSGNYTFPNHVVIDDMFCKNKFTSTSFSLILFFKRNSFMNSSLRNPDYDISRQVILSDPINNNCVYYNERDMTLNIEFHGYHSEIFVNFVPGMWYQLTLRYDYEKQLFNTTIHYKNLIAASEYEFLSTSSTRKLNNSLVLDEDKELALNKRFQLNSFYAEYSFSEKGYIKPFDTLCGPIVLYDNYQEDIVINGIFESFYPVLNYYKDVGGIYTEQGILFNY